MADPVTLTLASVASLAVAEGVKFLYAQAGELLKWRRSRRPSTADSAQASPLPSTVRVETPPAIEGGSFEARPDVAALGRLEGELRALRADLLEHVEGVDAPATSDPEFLRRADALRRALEVIYHRPLTFAGEVRGGSGPTVDVDISADSVAGYIAAVRANAITGGTIDARMRVDQVAGGASVIGVDAGLIGESPPRT